MLEALLETDKQLLLWLNSHHAPWLDPVMLVLTKTIAWLPLYLLLLFLVFKEHQKNSWRVLLVIGVTLLLTDHTTSSLMKPYFERLRPSREPELAGLLHLVNGYKGGLYGFASSHAANSFGLAMLFWLMFSKSKPWIGLLFIWALFNSYTRIYLGVHYPGDIIVGALVGLCCAFLTFLLYKRFLDPLRQQKLN
ncbi:phosphatase PAP2 family protein [Oscillatoria amoena NRMC-F 0135]|nr:phosphatase PAP2 family protein [Oscillatoria amoena NRMC-F 0135]